tara:strand:+ start:4727 stop:6391 length:1665 start_codon:yes stop_codon:yes gene_type:complete
MLTNLIENRGKEFSNLIKIGDYLARTLRENVELFSVEEGKATYLSEHGSVISGDYTFKPTLKLSKIVVEDAKVLEDKKCFDEAADKKVTLILSNLIENDYQSAEGSFDDILSMYETKLTYERIKKRLEEKTSRFGESTKIVSSKEFTRVNELRSQLVDFLRENNDIMQSETLKTGLKLINLVSTSFDLPKRTIEQIQESGEITVNFVGKNNLYEHLCRKELIQKELLEAKSNFENIWIDSPSVQDLASLVFESDTDSLRHQVAQVVSDSPYLALSTKKQISSLISNCLSVNEVKVSKGDLNKFASKIYEMKKPIKNYVLDVLNEKYGIDVRKLDEVPTFRTLTLTEGEIINQIAAISPEESVIQKTLIEFANSLQSKNGVESIDLAVFLEDLFSEAGHQNSINEASLMDYMDFTKVADDLGKIGKVLKMLVPAVDSAAEELKAEADKEVSDDGDSMPKEDPLGAPDDLDSDSEVPMDKPDMDAEEAAQEVKDEDETMKKDQEPEEEAEEEEEEPEMSQDELTSLLSKLEDLLDDIKPEEDGEKEEKKDPEQYKT